MLPMSVAVRVTKHHTYHTDEIPGCLHVQSNNRQQIQTQSDSTGLVSQHALCCILLQHHTAHCLGMTVMQKMILCWFRHWLCARKHRFMQMVSCCCCCCLPIRAQSWSSASVVMQLTKQCFISDLLSAFISICIAASSDERHADGCHCISSAAEPWRPGLYVQ